MKVYVLSLALIGCLQANSFVWADQYDPMAPPGYGNTTKNSTIKKMVENKTYYNLRQIVISDNGNRAVINGYLVKEGEYINSARVMKIEVNKVTLSKAGKVSVIKLNNPVKKVRR
jgi:hypothetical protein